MKWLKCIINGAPVEQDNITCGHFLDILALILQIENFLTCWYADSSFGHLPKTVVVGSWDLIYMCHSNVDSKLHRFLSICYKTHSFGHYAFGILLRDLWRIHVGFVRLYWNRQTSEVLETCSPWSAKSLILECQNLQNVRKWNGVFMNSFRLTPSHFYTSHSLGIFHCETYQLLYRFRKCTFLLFSKRVLRSPQFSEVAVEGTLCNVGMTWMSCPTFRGNTHV